MKIVSEVGARQKGIWLTATTPCVGASVDISNNSKPTQVTSADSLMASTTIPY